MRSVRVVAQIGQDSVEVDKFWTAGTSSGLKGEENGIFFYRMTSLILHSPLTTFKDDRDRQREQGNTRCLHDINFSASFWIGMHGISNRCNSSSSRVNAYNLYCDWSSGGDSECRVGSHKGRQMGVRKD